MAEQHLFQDNPQGDGIVYSLMDDFFSDFEYALQNCETLLIDLENHSDSQEMLNSLFRSVHTVKGNLFSVGLNELSPIIQSTEDLLDAIRKQQIEYNSYMCDVILLSLDITKRMIEAKIEKTSAPMSDQAIANLCQDISSIAEVSEDHRLSYIQRVIIALDPNTHIFDSDNVLPHQSGNKQKVPLTISQVLEHHKVTLDQDIEFFLQVAQPIESRSLYWQGRSARLLQLSLAMNEQANSPVANQQLTVAVLLHDIGMAFLPLDMLHKQQKYSDQERLSLQRHPLVGQQLLSESQHWQQAAQIILQHHERIDGSGYPNQLVDKQICAGAKILAIADTYDAHAHARAHHSQLKRPFIRSVLEINNCQGSQFDVYWVEIFNKVARDVEHREWN